MSSLPKAILFDLDETIISFGSRRLILQAVIEEMNLDGVAKDGVVVRDVARGSIAERFLRVGDVLLAINAEEVRQVADLRKLVEKGADQWRLTLRRGGRVITVNVR